MGGKGSDGGMSGHSCRLSCALVGLLVIGSNMALTSGFVQAPTKSASLSSWRHDRQQHSPSAATTIRPSSTYSISGSSSNHSSKRRGRALMQQSAAAAASPSSRGAAAVRTPPQVRTSAKLESEFFDLDGRRATFGSVQSLEAIMHPSSFASWGEYLLGDASNIVYAVWDRDRLEDRGDGRFRLSISPREFLGLRLSLTVDVRLWVTEDGTLRCESEGWDSEELKQVLGEDFAESFSVEISGELQVSLREKKIRAITLKNTLLKGNIDVTVGGNLPSMLQLTPTPLLKGACLGINEQVLAYVSKSFVNTLADSHASWELRQAAGGGRGRGGEERAVGR